MHKSVMSYSVALIALAMVSPAFAQRDAGSKIRGDYNFYSGNAGRTYQRHAREHSQVLNDFSAAKKSVPKAVAQEHAQAIRDNVESAKKAYSRLGETAKKDPAAAKHLTEIKAAHDQVLAMCDMLDQECLKAEGDSVAICKCCDEIEKHLEAADKAHGKLMKQLKLEAPSGKSAE